mmetsp:Transcript_98945/g.284260  ORF Transcript_98945/g.284260 Transcript_98945/m.284260 type:complete len:765 (+) Transcript_98945:43-2337(+)
METEHLDGDHLAKQLTPFGPIPRRHTTDFNLEPVNSLLEELGFNGPRAQLRDEAFAEFKRVAGADGENMTEERFIAIAAQLWGLDRLSARSTFHASDLNFSGRLSETEYLILREAFIHPRLDDEEEPEAILEIQLRGAFNRYVLSRPAQRIVRGTVLTRTEVVELVRDLCSGDTHVRKVAAQLLPQLMVPGQGTPGKQRESSDSIRSFPSEVLSVAGDDDDEDDDELSVKEFVSKLMQDDFKAHLAEQDLSIKDLVWSIVRGRRAGRGSAGGHQGATCSRVVLDGRAETATMMWHPPLDLNDRFDVDAVSMFAARQLKIESDVVPTDAINEDMRLTPHVRAVGGWRGPLAVGRETEEYRLAFQVIESARRLARDAAMAPDVLDKDWCRDGEALKAMLGHGEVRQAQTITCLAKACRVQLEAQSNLVRVQVPAKVFGDIHGQFRDLLLLFEQFGFPYHCGGDIQTTSYVFDGDFVDRGEHQIEVVLLLFALKTVYPSHIFLVRGNHEFREMSELGTSDCFQRHIKWRLPQTWKPVYNAIHEAFDWLPMAALVGGRALVLHGGLGDGSWGLRDIEKMDRPLVSPSAGLELDLVWSDPSDSDHIMWKGVHENPDRGDTKIHLFGPDVTAAFCEREQISVVIRAHQYVPQGYKVMHSGRLLTVFSARNYCGVDDNDAALLLLAPDHNGHLRVHPKRLLGTPLLKGGDDRDEDEAAQARIPVPGDVRSSWSSAPSGSGMPGCSSCLAFLKSGTRPQASGAKRPGGSRAY